MIHESRTTTHSCIASPPAHTCETTERRRGDETTKSLYMHIYPTNYYAGFTRSAYYTQTTTKNSIKNKTIFFGGNNIASHDGSCAFVINALSACAIARINWWRRFALRMSRKMWLKVKDRRRTESSGWKTHVFKRGRRTSCGLFILFESGQTAALGRLMAFRQTSSRWLSGYGFEVVRLRKVACDCDVRVRESPPTKRGRKALRPGELPAR